MLLLANVGSFFPSQGFQQYFFFDISDSTFYPIGDTIINRNVIAGQAANAQDLFALLDPGGSYPYSSNWKQFLAHSTDSGKNWSYSYPVDTTAWKKWTSFEPMEKGYGNGHYFLTGGRVTDTIAGERTLIDDYMETTDDGTTWKTVSNVSGGRVFRLANPDSNVIWAAVGRVPDLPEGEAGFITSDTETYKGTRIKLVDSMFTSLDGGKTWSKDGTTFAGDTICAMRWLTGTNGYVITYHNDSTFLYHFRGYIDTTTDTSHLGVFTQTSTASTELHNHPVKLTAFPDPTNDFLHVNIPANDGITDKHIYDVVEREVHPPMDFQAGELTVDVRDLSTGSYFMQIAGTSGYTYIVRFTRQP